MTTVLFAVITPSAENKPSLAFGHKVATDPLSRHQDTDPVTGVRYYVSIGHEAAAQALCRSLEIAFDVDDVKS